MRRTSIILFCALSITAVLAQEQQSPQPAAENSKDTELTLGLEAARARNYPAAISHFNAAREADPNSPVALRAIGMAYLLRYTPGADSAEARSYLQLAISAFTQALDRQPQDVIALRSVGYSYVISRQYSAALPFYRRLMHERVRDAYAQYAVSATDALLLTQQIGTAEKSGGFATQCKALQKRFMPFVDEGLKSGQRALTVAPDFQQAAVALYWLEQSREKLVCGSVSSMRSAVTLALQRAQQAKGVPEDTMVQESAPDADPAEVQVDRWVTESAQWPRLSLGSPVEPAK